MQIIKLWKPLKSNPYFNVNHAAWTINSLIRGYVFRAKCDLCVSHIRIEWRTPVDLKLHTIAAIEIVREIAQMDPFTVDNSDLPADMRRLQNDDYRDFCRLVLDWYKYWADGSSVFGEEVSIQCLMMTIQNRLEELIQLLGQARKA
ncbi:MAG: hypothetical protein EOO27_13050 [Comamonadaceae bacterium]|nr:MAG: hypothetical protein EOO27_13050 [Comamonadaceae bacterium]